MSKRSLEDGKYLSDSDQESDDATSSSKKRRARGAYLTAVDKEGIEGVRSRPRKMPRKLQTDFVKQVQKGLPYLTPSSASRINSSDVAGLASQDIQLGNLPDGDVPDIARAVQSTGTEVDVNGCNSIAALAGSNQARTGTGQAQPSDLFLRAHQRAFPTNAVPGPLLLPGSTVQPLRATSHPRLHQMPTGSYPTMLESAFLQQRLLNNRIASRVTNAMQDLMELELLQSHLINYPSSVLQQNLHQRPNFTPSSPSVRNLLSTMQIAGSSALLNNRGIQLDPSSALAMNPYLSSSRPMDQILAGTPTMDVHSQAPSLGMGQVAAAYASSFQIPQGILSRFESPDSQRQQEQQARVDHREDIPVLSREIGRVEPMELDTDSASLSPFQCLARKQIEFFEAKATDVAAGARGRNNPISLGQVGIRCRHCSSCSPATRGRAAVYFPTKFDLVYQTAVNMTSTHLCIHCKHVPTETREQLVRLRDQRSTVGGGKAYWADATKKLGIVETQRGLRFKE
jgi:hypothetical protein